MKLWKGRFAKASTSSADEFNASIGFDQRLYKEDITGSIAHAKMLGKQGILTTEESQLIVQTLQEILADIERVRKEDAERLADELFRHTPCVSASGSAPKDTVTLGAAT